MSEGAIRRDVTIIKKEESFLPGTVKVCKRSHPYWVNTVGLKAPVTVC